MLVRSSINLADTTIAPRRVAKVKQDAKAKSTEHARKIAAIRRIAGVCRIVATVKSSL